MKKKSQGHERNSPREPSQHVSYNVCTNSIHFYPEKKARKLCRAVRFSTIRLVAQDKSKSGPNRDGVSEVATPHNQTPQVATSYRG